MLDDCGFEVYEENPFPIAYLLTFRTFGTWLHGDDRVSYGRYRRGPEGTKHIPSIVPLNESMFSEMKRPPVVLDEAHRRLVTEAINEVCEFRKYSLQAINVRSNHAHSVVSAAVKPEKVVNDFKAYATRKLRQHFLLPDEKLWARGASTRYLWKPRHVAAAIDYILYCQEDVPFEFRGG